jgi:phosphoribosylformimino-5-aminoimidazole carboxamide ribotide isomerase
MLGPNIALYRTIVARDEGFLLQASGGMRDVADIVDARDAGCAGAVLGRALLEGGMTIEDALTC